MGLRNHYLKDKARIRRPVTNFNKGLVSHEKEMELVTDWIPARLRTKAGTESPEDARTALDETYELVLSVYDISGNKVQIEQADVLEISTAFDEELAYPIENYKISGSIVEVRKVTKLVSYVIPVVRETEF